MPQPPIAARMTRMKKLKKKKMKKKKMMMPSILVALLLGRPWQQQRLQWRWVR